jgi:hypothetical protein
VRGAAAALLTLILTLVPASPAAAGTERQVFLFITQGVSYEEAVSVDGPLRRWAQAGGIGLMTGGGDGGAGSFATLGAGASIEAPSASVVVEEADGGLIVDVAGGTDGDAEPGALASELAAAGRTVGYLGASTAPDPAMLVAADREGRIPLIQSGGAEDGEVDRADLVVSPDLDLIETTLQESTADDVLLMVVVAAPSSAMMGRGDNVTPLVVARGSPESLLGINEFGLGQPTSETTRRDGIVANIDVAPTVLDFLGLEIPEEMAGSPMRTVDVHAFLSADEDPISKHPVTDLHSRYLEYRKVVTPIGVVVLLFAVASLVAALVVLLWRRTVRPTVARSVALWGLFAVSLLVALVPGGLLPTYDLALVVPALVAVAAVVTALAMRLGRGDPAGPVAVVAGTGLALVVVDGFLGWPTGLTPLFGGSALDGVRFFGLGNTSAGIVMAGAVLVSARLGPWPGVWLVLAAALFAGLPFLGADLGGGVTLFAVSGLWYARRVRTMGWRGQAVWTAAGAVAGLLLVVGAHEVLPPGTTHVSRAVEGAGGAGGIVEVFLRRLEINLQATADTPSVWLALAGLPVWLAVAALRPGPFRQPLERMAVWRGGVVVLAVGGMIGYVLNDTYGMAAVTFPFLSAAMVYPAVRWNSA